VVENEMKINPGKCKAIRFTTAIVKIHWITPFVTKIFWKRSAVNAWEQS
jgi:predicted transcriptional regulator